MNCLRDYVGFAIWFAGVGYIVLWPLSASGASGALFGASIVCHAPTAPGVLAALCRAPHPLTLSPPLHVLGFATAVAVTLRLVCRGLRCARRSHVVQVNARRVVRVPPVLMSAPRPRPQPPLPRVKPRSQFGLRGTPH